MSNATPDEDKEQFLKSASHDKERGLVGEFFGFMRENKAWWMTPILVVLAFVGELLGMVATGALPFLYTLF